MITVIHNVKKIHQVLERVKGVTEYRWWDTLFGWSPTATGVLNKLSHPIIILLILVLIGFVLSAILYIMNWRIMKRLTQLTSTLNLHRSVTIDIPKVIDARRTVILR